MAIRQFIPTGGNASSVSLAATTSTGNVALSPVPKGSCNLRIYNAGSATIFIALGTSSAATASATTSVPVPAGAIEIWDLPEGITHIAGITAASTGTIWFTVGQGE